MPQPVTRLFPPSEAKVKESGPPDCLQTSNKQNMTQLKTQMHSTPPARDRPGHKLYGYLICHANDQDLLTESQTSAKRAFILYRLCVLAYVYRVFRSTVSGNIKRLLNRRWLMHLYKSVKLGWNVWSHNLNILIISYSLQIYYFTAKYAHPHTVLHLQSSLFWNWIIILRKLLSRKCVILFLITLSLLIFNVASFISQRQGLITG